MPTRHLLQALETEERRLRQVELELNSKIDQLERDGATKTQKLNDYMTAIEEISVMVRKDERLVMMF